MWIKRKIASLECGFSPMKPPFLWIILKKNDSKRNKTAQTSFPRHITNENKVRMVETFTNETSEEVFYDFEAEAPVACPSDGPSPAAVALVRMFAHIYGSEACEECADCVFLPSAN